MNRLSEKYSDVTHAFLRNQLKSLLFAGIICKMAELLDLSAPF